MKRKKTAAFLTASLIALTGFPGTCFSAASPPVAAAADSGTAKMYPDWIPSSYDSALEFRNTYGHTHIDGNWLCIVFEQEDSYDEDDDSIRYQLYTKDGIQQLCRQEVYTNAKTGAKIEVAVFTVTEAGEFGISVIDTWAKADAQDSDHYHAVAHYSFSADKYMCITQTDIYGWLPDCETEYREFTANNLYLDAAVVDNYVLFCLSYSAGTAFHWSQKSDGSECFESAAVSDCTPVYAEAVAGGAVNTIYAFKAVKDGLATISYEYGPFYLDDKVTETRNADCAVFNDAQNVLLSGQMRITLADYDTGEAIPIAEDSHIYAATNISFIEPEGSVSTGPILDLQQNPSVHNNIGGMFNADSFSFWLDPYNLPEGYAFPAGAQQMGWFDGAILPKNGVIVNRFENGSADVTFRLVKKAPADLNADETRITLYDKDTGELIPSELLENHIWSFGTDIRIAAPEATGGWMYTGPVYIVKENPAVYKTDLAKLYRTADVFNFICDDQPEVTVYDNGAIDIVFYTKLTVNGNINGDGQFTDADVTTLQKWLSGDSEVTIFDWGSGDFNLDNKLTAADLTLMKRALLKKPAAVSLTVGGGFAGTVTTYSVYREGDKFLCSKKGGTLTDKIISGVWEITKDQYWDTMSINYDSYLNQPATEPEFDSFDGYMYQTTLTYPDGSKAQINRMIPELNSRISSLLSSPDNT